MAKNLQTHTPMLVYDQVRPGVFAKRAILGSTRPRDPKMALFAGPRAGAILAGAMAVLVD